MAKFLNTTATNYLLEELIKSAQERLVLISPFLKLNERIRELLDDKNRLKVDVRIIYGKNELHNNEISWLSEQEYIRTSFCKNLHAKCYLNEDNCIITSMNLYEFSQVNNNEMGVSVSKTQDSLLYREAYEEAQRIIRISDEVRISLKKVEQKDEASEKKKAAKKETVEKSGQDQKYIKLTTSKLAKKLNKTTKELSDSLVKSGYLETDKGEYGLTEKGRQAGGEKKKGRFGAYFLWNADLTV
ncbi:MAG: DNA repair protein [Candidatus Electrothrix sp. AR4]|nr:DNA repair protein [Candidatus Electrothrix sp. AR4]